MGMENYRALIFAFSLLFLASSSLVFALATAATPNPDKKAICNYTITIETTCAAGAETSNHVSLRFGDAKSNDVVVHHLNSKRVTQVDPFFPAELDGAPVKPFRACSVDEFQVSGGCVESPVCYLYLKLVGTDDWRPGFAQVRAAAGNHLSSNYFYIRRYLPRNAWHGLDMCDREVTPFGVKHERKVFVKRPVRTLEP